MLLRSADKRLWCVESRLKEQMTVAPKLKCDYLPTGNNKEG